MASILKNQIFKLLSKFTKDLSTDKINLSTFKGEGELSNLNLDEIILTDLLELPSWLRITSAWCDKVYFRVQWTQLKSVPIHLSLNKVIIEVETCEELRTTSCVQGLSSYAGATKYGFIHKVIDGVTITVNTVKIIFKSPAFLANVEVNINTELSRIIVQSTSRDWEECKLTASRLKDNDRGQVLLFKEIEWNDARIEAKSTKDQSLTPLRLITNKAKCRITLKKKLLDSSIMGCRLAIILEDLLWVLTDFQLKAALHFIDSLVGLIEKVSEVTKKKKAARKLETLPEYQAQQSQSSQPKVSSSPLSELFNKYDVVETSYHFQAQKIDLHFSDDPSAGRSCHPELKQGGAFQISLKMFRVDYYPYHLAIAERYHWATYKQAATPHTQWLKDAQAEFTAALLALIGDKESPSKAGATSPHTSVKDNKQNSGCGSLKGQILKKMNTMMTSCFIIRIADFNMYQVTTSGAKKHVPKEFISCDKDRYSLPESEAAIHAEFTYFYCPGDDPFPLPSPKFYVRLNPVQVHFDVISILWVNAFALNLYQSLLQTKGSQSSSTSDYMYFDVKVEAILPRIILESPIDYPGQKDRPKSLHIQVSRACITNVRSNDQSSRADLGKCVDLFQMCPLFFNRDFPSQPDDFILVSKKFFDHFSCIDNVRPHPSQLYSTSADADFLRTHLNREMLWTEAKDVWCIHLEPIFGDFFGARAVGKDYPVPFLEAFPLTLWVYLKMPTNSKSTPTTPTADQATSQSSEENSADIQILAHISTLVSIQLNHYQYLFLLRLLEDAKELATYLGIDSNRIAKQFSSSSMVIGGVIPELNVTFVMPSHSPGKESSGGDIESVIPDSSSLQDDVICEWNYDTGILNIKGSNSGLLQGKCQTSVSDCSIDTQKISFDQPIKKTANGNVKPLYPSLGNKSLSLDGASQTQKKPLSFLSSSIKKGFDKMMISIDTGTKTSPEEISDNISVRSDLSSDSETLMVISSEPSGTTFGRFKDGLESLFKMNLSGNQADQLQSIEIATEVIEEENTLTSPSERDSSTGCNKRRDLVSISTFKLPKVEFQQQSEGLSSVLKIQISGLSVEDCTSIPWDEFQTKFIARSRDWVEVPLAGLCPRIKIRMNHNLKTDPKVFQGLFPVDHSHLLNAFDDNATVRLESINLSANASSISGLIDLLEEELTPTPFPVTIFLENLKIRIVEDRPPCNITSPDPLPIDVVVSRLLINRLSSGVIEIEPYDLEAEKSQLTDAETEMSPNGPRLMLENEELRRRLAVLEGISEENYRLKKYQQDAEQIRSRLQDALNEIDILLQNKKNLLDRISELENKYQLEWNAKR